MQLCVSVGEAFVVVGGLFAVDNGECLAAPYSVAHLDGEAGHTTRTGNEELPHKALVAAHVAVERELVAIAAQHYRRGLDDLAAQGAIVTRLLLRRRARCQTKEAGKEKDISFHHLIIFFKNYRGYRSYRYYRYYRYYKIYRKSPPPHRLPPFASILAPHTILSRSAACSAWLLASRRASIVSR